MSSASVLSFCINGSIFFALGREVLSFTFFLVFAAALIDLETISEALSIVWLYLSVKTGGLGDDWASISLFSG